MGLIKNTRGARYVVICLALVSCALPGVSAQNISSSSSQKIALSKHLTNEKVLIEAGQFTPLYGLAQKQKSFPVKEFLIDRYPVTNQDFAQFVSRNSSWKKGQIASLFSDANYLRKWISLDSAQFVVPESDLEVPVTNVSWFAAAAFCLDKGGKLPSVLQWEYVAAASESKKDASRDPEYIEKLLEWYSKPLKGGKLAEIGGAPPNAWGVYNLHGLVWEWTDDFNSVLISGDSRKEGDSLKNLFCGSAALGAADRANYAAYMRYALRSSLKAEYTMDNLGFRCVYEK